MKIRNTLGMCAVLAASLLAVGCASTRTQKSAGEQLDDTVVTARVKEALIANPDTKARQIDVEVFRGRVQLNGFVDSAAGKTRAAEVARGVNGVASVTNNLVVQTEPRTAGEAIDDGVITTKVKAALAGDKRTEAHQINVETRDGVVQLTGFVDNREGMTAAVQVARGVNGVRDVRSGLQVKTK